MFRNKNMLKASLKFVSLTFFVLILSCSPEHDGVSNSPSLSGVTLNPNPDPLLKAAAENILGSRCISCHGSSGANQKFLLTASDPGLDDLALNTRYVSPGQSNISMLAIRSADGSMPPGSPLNTSEAQAIADWIDDLAAVNNDGPPAATFSEIETQILTPKCYTCHTSGGGASTVMFSDYTSVLSTIVVPGNIDSAFYQSTARVSDPMPKNQTPLTTNELDMISSWILDGAPNN